MNLNVSKRSYSSNELVVKETSCNFCINLFFCTTYIFQVFSPAREFFITLCIYSYVSIFFVFHWFLQLKDAILGSSAAMGFLTLFMSIPSKFFNSFIFTYICISSFISLFLTLFLFEIHNFILLRPDRLFKVFSYLAWQGSNPYGKIVFINLSYILNFLYIISSMLHRIPLILPWIFFTIVHFSISLQFVIKLSKVTFEYVFLSSFNVLTIFQIQVISNA